MLSEHRHFPWLGLQTTEHLRSAWQITTNGQKRTQSDHIQDKNFHPKHRKNLYPASQPDKKTHYQFSFINPQHCLIGAMPTCSVIKLITTICSMWLIFNVLCYSSVKRPWIGLKTHRAECYTQLWIDYLWAWIPPTPRNRDYKRARVMERKVSFPGTQTRMD